MTPQVVSPESMYELIREYGVLPFFENPIAGFSVADHTAPEHWFTEDNLGPPLRPKWGYRLWQVPVGRESRFRYGGCVQGTHELATGAEKIPADG